MTQLNDSQKISSDVLVTGSLFEFIFTMSFLGCVQKKEKVSTPSIASMPAGEALPLTEAIRRSKFVSVSVTAGPRPHH